MKQSLDQKRIKAIEGVGVTVFRDEKWVGEVGVDRHPEPLLDTVRGLHLPLSPGDWCKMCMREGEYYVGGCCGNTSAIQDIINGAFRDSGYLDAADFLALGELARDHEGFEDFLEMDDERFMTLIAVWDELEPWMKLGVIYNAVEPALTPRSYETPKQEPDSLRILAATLQRIQWSEVFGSDKNEEETRAKRLVLFAKALQPTRELLKTLEDSDENFSGFAIVEPGTDNVHSNMAGLCLYPAYDDAKRIIELWQRSAKEDNEEATKAEIVTCQVTVKDGLVLRV